MDHLEWLSLEPGLEIAFDESWLKHTSDDGSTVFIKTEDKSVWIESVNGELIPVENTRDYPPSLNESQAGTDDDADSAHEAQDTAGSYQEQIESQFEAASDEEANLDLAEIRVTLLHKPSNQAPQDCNSYPIQGVFLPIDAYTEDDTLSVCHGVTLADGSNRSAELVCEALPKNLLSAFHTLWAKRNSQSWQIQTKGAQMRDANGAWVWDCEEGPAPEFEKVRAPIDGTLGDSHSVVMLEAMLKAFHQTSQNLINSNISKKEFGGASAICLNFYGPCNDGGLRAVIGSLGSLSCCLVKKNSRVLHLLPPSSRTLQTDYLPRSTKLRKKGVLLENKALKTDDWPQVVCHLSRGFGHVQLMCRLTSSGSVISDLSQPVIKRKPDLALLQIDPDEDSLILIADTELVDQQGWSSLVETLAFNPDATKLQGRLLQGIHLFQPVESTSSTKRIRTAGMKVDFNGFDLVE